MTWRRRLLLGAAVLCFGVLPCGAAERYLDFAEGLCEREYFDVAVEYLESLKGRADLPDDVREVLSYEMASALMQWARGQWNVDKANEQLDRAKALYEEFVKASPGHPFVDQANTDLAQVLLQKGKIAVLQARALNVREKRKEAYAQARHEFSEARKVFEASHARRLAAWKAFPAYIDPAKDKQALEARGKAELVFIQSQFDLAMLTFEEAQAHEPDSADRKQALGKATAQFDAIANRYRNMMAGLYARLYEGKCLEELHHERKALDIYAELLSMKPESAAVKRLQDQALDFRLGCLNRSGQEDHAQVVQESEAWLKANATRTRSKLGIGIRWELAQAQEALGKSVGEESERRSGLLGQALDNARLVNRSGGEYKEASQAMIQRISLALQPEPGEPGDFDAAFALARLALEKIKAMNENLALAPPETSPKLRHELELQAKQTVTLLKSALLLVQPDTRLREVNQVRYWLCFADYLLGKNYDAAIRGEFLARRYAKHEDSGNIPIEAAYLAMGAYGGVCFAPKNTHPEADAAHLIDICRFIQETWPQSEKSNEASLMLGRAYARVGQYARAAENYAAVAESGPRRQASSLAAGQAYWNAYLQAKNSPESARVPADTLTEYRTRAAQYVEAAISEGEAALSEDQQPPDALILAKFTAAQIANETGNFNRVVELLESGPHAVLGATYLSLLPYETPPAQGLKSKRFACDVYRQLLRAYAGNDSPEAADRIKGELEKIEAELDERGESAAHTIVAPTRGKPTRERRAETSKAPAVPPARDSSLSDADVAEASDPDAPAWFDPRFVVLLIGTAAVLVAFRLMMSRKVRGAKVR